MCEATTGVATMRFIAIIALVGASLAGSFSLTSAPAGATAVYPSPINYFWYAEDGPFGVLCSQAWQDQLNHTWASGWGVTTGTHGTYGYLCGQGDLTNLAANTLYAQASV